MSAKSPDEKVLFGLSQDPDGTLNIILLVTPQADAYMRDGTGKAHDFDLTKLGAPIKIVMGACKDRADGVRMIEQGNSARGVATMRMDTAAHDFGIPGTKRDGVVTDAPPQTGVIVRGLVEKGDPELGVQAGTAIWLMREAEGRFRWTESRELAHLFLTVSTAAAILRGTIQPPGMQPHPASLEMLKAVEIPARPASFKITGKAEW